MGCDFSSRVKDIFTGLLLLVWCPRLVEYIGNTSFPDPVL